MSGMKLKEINNNKKKMLLYVIKATACWFLFQALVKGGLASLAQDPGFVSVTKEEMADAMHTTVDEMESVAEGILSERSGSVTSAKKRRPIPVPPPAPAVAPRQTRQPDPAVRRKRRPIPTIPSVQESAEADSKV